MNCIKVPSFMNDLSDFLRENGGVEKYYSKPCPVFGIFIVYIDIGTYERLVKDL